jgi:GT2 family glycosyltransferase
VVIPTWNGSSLLRTVLASVKQQTYPIERVVVVDDGSTDAAVGHVAREFGCTVLRHESNQGFASAVNRGVHELTTDWTVVLNTDVRIPPDWISTLVSGALAADATFAVGKLLSSSNPGRIDGTYDLVSRGATSWRCGSGRVDGPIWSRPEAIQFTSFTAVLLKTSTFRSLGGLDTRFGSYLEDVDFSLRCAAKGLRGVYVPNAVGTHQGSATLGAWQKATIRLISRNHILLYYKHFRGGSKSPFVVGQLLWIALAFDRGAGRPALRGLLDGLLVWRLWRDEPSDWAAVKRAVTESERTIFAIQKETGFDTYWRWYFRLIRP